MSTEPKPTPTVFSPSKKPSTACSFGPTPVAQLNTLSIDCNLGPPHVAQLNPASKVKDVLGPVSRAKLYLKPRGKLLLKWRVKGVFRPFSSGLSVDKGSGFHHPQPKGPSAGRRCGADLDSCWRSLPCGEGESVSPELAGSSIFDKDLASGFFQTLSHSCASDSTVEEVAALVGQGLRPPGSSIVSMVRGGQFV